MMSLNLPLIISGGISPGILTINVVTIPISQELSLLSPGKSRVADKRSQWKGTEREIDCG